jgi:hypothetical protein
MRPTLVHRALGEDRSFLWAVSKDGLTTHTLPPRAEIERTAESVYVALTARARVGGESLQERHCFHVSRIIARSYRRLARDAFQERTRSRCWKFLPKRESFTPTMRSLTSGRILERLGCEGRLTAALALPLAADSLRASRSRESSGEVISIAAADPLNLVGIVVPGERIPANSGRSFLLRDGVAVEAAPTPMENLLNARAG